MNNFARRVTPQFLVLLCIMMLAGRVTAATPTAEHLLMQLDTSSPRATLRSFISALEEAYQIAGESGQRRDTLDPLNRAVMSLDLSEVPPYLVPTQGPEIAMMLKEVLDRIEHHCNLGALGRNEIGGHLAEIQAHDRAVQRIQRVTPLPGLASDLVRLFQRGNEAPQRCSRA